MFLHVGLAGTHHCPEIWHAGDNPPTDQTLDWGVFQTMAVGCRPTVDNNHFWSSVSFGQHALHHLFPTIDQEYLIGLHPIYEQTLKDFGLLEVIKGQNRQYGVWAGWMGLFQQVRHPRSPVASACVLT